MPYDNAAETMNSKLKKLENPDLRFLKYASPHPKLSSLDHILSSPGLILPLCPMVSVSPLSLISRPRPPPSESGLTPDHVLSRDSTNGTAQFLEHMLFKGTESAAGENWKKKSRTRRVNELAYISREHITLYKVLDTNVNQALDMQAAMLQKSEFREARINQEREVILRKIREVEGQTQEVVPEHLHATAFQVPTHTSGKNRLGPAQNIKSISRDDLQNFIKTHFTAPKTVIAQGARNQLKSSLLLNLNGTSQVTEDIGR